MALDLGKQMGPLPLGAWIVVVAGGLGIAYYTKTHAAPADPTIDTSGQPGVGDGSVGGWVPTSPNTSDTGNAASNTAPTTNEEWAYQAKQLLIGLGYPATTVSSAIDKYVNGLTPSIQEYTLVGIALAKIGPLPQTLPTGPAEPGGNTPPPSTDPNASSMPYAVDQKLTNIQKGRVTMSWGVIGRPNYTMVYNGSRGIPILPGTHSHTFTGLNPGPHRFGVAFAKGVKLSPRQDINITLTK